MDECCQKKNTALIVEKGEIKANISHPLKRYET
jgi:hypothetical protein